MESLPKSIYIWSKSFGRFDNNKLIDFLASHSFNKVMLAIGPNEEFYDKAMTFIERARQAEIEVELLKGNNHLIFKDRFFKIDELTENALQLGAKGIHLDVEPHALVLDFDWEDLYIAMLQYAAKQAKKANLTLVASLPLYYNLQILKNAYLFCDSVYLMAYGRSTLNRIEKDLTQKLKVNYEQTVLAFRLIDFNNLEQLQIFATNVMQNIHVKGYAVHDLDACLNH